MKIYFNHKADLCDVIVRFGFTDDIFRSRDFDAYPGVEVRDAEPDPNEGCVMPPEGATVEMDVPEGELLEYEVLAEGWEQDGFRHAGYGYREFIVPAKVLNRYGRRLYEHDAGQGE